MYIIERGSANGMKRPYFTHTKSLKFRERRSCTSSFLNFPITNGNVRSSLKITAREFRDDILNTNSLHIAVR